MVWHIFKKDFRLLWPLSLAVISLGALNALRPTFGGHFFQAQSALEQFTFFLPDLLYLGIAMVAVIVVHQDALPESQDDWLVRPLRRRDLALAKVLFVLLTVNVPLMIIDVLLQLALHFPLPISVGVAASRALLLVLMCSLPALMVGAVTRSLVDAFLFGFASAIALVLLLIVSTTISPNLTGLSGVAGILGVQWLSFWAAAGVIVIGSAASLTLQYSTRRTVLAWSIGLAAVFAALSTFWLLPNTVTLAIQESLWGPPNSDGIRLSFDPSSPEARSGQGPGLGYGIGAPLSSAQVAANAAVDAVIDRQVEKVRLPLSISGMQPGDILLADRIDVRLVSMAGKILYKGAGVCTRVSSGTGCARNDLEVWASSANVPNEEELNLPIRLYQRIKDEPVRVEVAYALTRFAPHPTQEINAIGGLKALPEMGSCATRIDSDGDEVQMGCLTDVGVPSCVGVVLEDPQTGRRNPELHKCDPSYGPYRGRGLKDAVGRVGLSIPFRDLSGLAHYPVDSAAIAHARIDVTVYDPVAHFRTTVAVSSVRLADWAPPNVESTSPAGVRQAPMSD